MTRSLHTLLHGLIDYAGLFPPATLGMAEAVAEYGRRRMSEEAFALGRFICPASRLDEFSAEARTLMPGTYATSGYREMAQAGMTDPWGVSVVVDTPLGEAVDRVDAFNDRHATEEQGLARADCLEVRAPEPGFIDEALDAIPADIRPFFEVPQEVVIGGDPRGFIAAVAGNEGAAAKIRCGGVKAEMIPPSGAIARFIVACGAADVAFKATAGLHHPVRAEQALTYEADPPRAVMHGFLNVFVASALVKARLADEAKCVEILEEADPGAFVLSEEKISFRGELEVDLVGLSRSRERFALGYGSCSFAEPMDDLRGLGLM
ncbi:MAG: hypothetical protein AAFR38_13560 [Planctomycetota bacterium]